VLELLTPCDAEYKYVYNQAKEDAVLFLTISRQWTSFDPDEIGFQHPTTATSPTASIFAQDLPLTSKKRHMYLQDSAYSRQFRQVSCISSVGELAVGLGLG
jgi:hypothetical protein